MPGLGGYLLRLVREAHVHDALDVLAHRDVTAHRGGRVGTARRADPDGGSAARCCEGGAAAMEGAGRGGSRCGAQHSPRTYCIARAPVSAPLCAAPLRVGEQDSRENWHRYQL